MATFNLLASTAELSFQQNVHKFVQLAYQSKKFTARSFYVRQLKRAAVLLLVCTVDWFEYFSDMGETTKSLDDLIHQLNLISDEPLNDTASEK